MMNSIPIDPQQVILNALIIMPVIFGLIEFLKSVLKLEGTAVTVMSFVVGFLLEGIFTLGSLLPIPYNTYVSLFFACLTVGLSVSGYYKYANVRIMRNEDRIEMARLKIR